jgi:hypothetical protein
MEKNKNPFKPGDTVKAVISGKRATVLSTPEAQGNGMIEVRFDGDTGSVVLHHTRFDLFEVKKISLPDEPYRDDIFERGDYILVTDKDGVGYSGAALNTIGHVGFATFKLLTNDGRLLDFNYNFVDVEVIFRADIARGIEPSY